MYVPFFDVLLFAFSMFCVELAESKHRSKSRTPFRRRKILLLVLMLGRHRRHLNAADRLNGGKKDRKQCFYDNSFREFEAGVQRNFANSAGWTEAHFKVVCERLRRQADLPI